MDELLKVDQTNDSINDQTISNSNWLSHVILSSDDDQNHHYDDKRIEDVSAHNTDHDEVSSLSSSGIGEVSNSSQYDDNPYALSGESLSFG